MPLRVDRPADGVARLTLDRPEKRNALSLELRVELAKALEAQAAAGHDVRCVVLTGAGTAFCAGMDPTTTSVPRCPPSSVATGEILDAEHALALGVVSEVHEPAALGAS